MVALRSSQVEAKGLSPAMPQGAWAGAQSWPEQEQSFLTPADALSCARAMSEPVRVELPLWTSWPGSHFTALPGQSPAKVVSAGISPTIMRAEVQAVGRAPYMATPSPEAGYLFPPGLTSSPGTPSQGSAEHASSNCKPCAWVWKAGGCQSGHLCSYCHLCPEGELKSRKKSKLLMLRLGLDTPKAASCESIGNADALTAPGFCFGDVSRGEASEAETTTASGSELGVQSPSPTDSLPSPPGFLFPLGPLAQAVPNAWSAPPLAQRVGSPSEGSALHDSGVCRPCAWYWKPSGCQKEFQCRFCHLCPDGEVKNRKKKKVASLRTEATTPKSMAAADCDGRFPLNLANCL